MGEDSGGRRKMLLPSDLLNDEEIRKIEENIEKGIFGEGNINNFSITNSVFEINNMADDLASLENNLNETDLLNERHIGERTDAHNNVRASVGESNNLRTHCNDRMGFDIQHSDGQLDVFNEFNNTSAVCGGVVSNSSNSINGTKSSAGITSITIPIPNDFKKNLEKMCGKTLNRRTVTFKSKKGGVYTHLMNKEITECQKARRIKGNQISKTGKAKAELKTTSADIIGDNDSEMTVDSNANANELTSMINKSAQEFNLVKYKKFSRIDNKNSAPVYEKKDNNFSENKNTNRFNTLNDKIGNENEESILLDSDKAREKNSNNNIRENDNVMNSFKNSVKNSVKDNVNNLSDNNVNTLISSDKTQSKVNLRAKEDNFCPPIFVTGIHANLIIELIQKFSKKVKFYIVNLKELGKLKVFVNDINVHSKVLEFIRKTKAEAYSFCPKPLKKPALLLKGIDANTNAADILDELKQHVPNIEFDKVTHFSTAKSRASGVPINAFLVQLKAGNDYKDLLKIRYLLYQRIHWEKLVKGDIVRCFRCQRFGHMANYCSYNERCMLCAGNHLISQCPFKSNSVKDPGVLKCSNCNETGHSANSKDCKVFLKYKERKSELKRAAKEMSVNRNRFVHQSINNFVNPSVSFARMVGSKHLDDEPDSNTVKNFINEAKSLFGIPLSSLINKIKAFWPNYVIIRNQDERMTAYLEFIASIVCNNGSK